MWKTIVTVEKGAQEKSYSYWVVIRQPDELIHKHKLLVSTSRCNNNHNLLHTSVDQIASDTGLLTMLSHVFY